MARKRYRRLIDVHAHILPNVDDGARTMEEACELIQMAREAGFRAIIATPHYSKHRGSNGYAEIVEKLQKKIHEIDPDFHIYLGQETYYHEELTERLKEGKALTMAGSRYVLIEFDPSVSFQTVDRAIRRLLTSGFVPVLAHMERYLCLREEKNLEVLCKSGCLMQMNYESLEGFWLSAETRWCRKQVVSGRIHFLGTDMHRVDHRPPEVSKAIEWLEKNVDAELFREMTYRNAKHMINNEKIG